MMPVANSWTALPISGTVTKISDNGLEGIIGETSGGGKPSRGEETVCGDEENAVEEGQHGPLRVITDRKGRKGEDCHHHRGFTLDDGGVADGPRD